MIIVATPLSNYFAYVGFVLIVCLLILSSQIPLRAYLLRSLIEIPFVIFAFLMPFFGNGEKIEFLGLSLYKAGLISGLSIIVKGTLGVFIAIILSATTSAKAILEGLARLRIPAPILGIASFMIRYMNVVNDELIRMRIARESRGFQAKGIRSWRVLAQTLGALFIRSYERGERVHLAMLSRGYQGKMPIEDGSRRSELKLAFLLPVTAGVMAVLCGVFT